MKWVKVIGILMAGVLFLSAFTSSNEISKHRVDKGWEKLGLKTVNMKADHDEIMVTHHKGHYTRLKFAIKKAPVFLRNINIVFGNGTNKNVVFNKRFNPGTMTRMIDLPGNKRVIKKIKLNYKTIRGHNGKAIVVAWGRH